MTARKRQKTGTTRQYDVGKQKTNLFTKGADKFCVYSLKPAVQLQLRKNLQGLGTMQKPRENFYVAVLKALKGQTQHSSALCAAPGSSKPVLTLRRLSGTSTCQHLSSHTTLTSMHTTSAGPQLKALCPLTIDNHSVIYSGRVGNHLPCRLTTVNHVPDLYTKTHTSRSLSLMYTLYTLSAAFPSSDFIALEYKGYTAAFCATVAPCSFVL